MAVITERGFEGYVILQENAGPAVCDGCVYKMKNGGSCTGFIGISYASLGKFLPESDPADIQRKANCHPTPRLIGY